MFFVQLASHTGGLSAQIAAPGTMEPPNARYGLETADCRLTERCWPRFADGVTCRRLSLFGSVLKGVERTNSDVDLLVEFVPGKEPRLPGLAEIEAELSALLGGRCGDLRTLPRI
jgi:predicted nucleotidyltransferase